jgi:hypothetical protein
MPAKLGWISHTSCILQPLFSCPLSFTKCNDVQKVFSLLNVHVWRYSNEQTCRTLWHYWTLQHRKVILHGHVVEYGTKTIAMSEGSRVHVKLPSRCLSCKSRTTLQLFKQLTALLQTISCRNVWGKQPTGTEQDSPHCLVWNSHKCPANTATKLEKYKPETKYGCVQRCLPTANPKKAALSFSSSNNQLHSCRLSIAEKHGANNWQEQSKAPHCLVWNSHKCPANKATKLEKYKWEMKYGCGAFPLPILQKQCRPSAL